MHDSPHIPEAGEREVAARLCHHGRADAPASVRLRSWTSGERRIRALRAWAVCWGLAVPAVFLPVLHFVLVPSLLVAGPIAGLLRLREEQTVLGASGACPACGESQSFPVTGAWRESVRLRCEKCGRAIELRAPAPVSAG